VDELCVCASVCGTEYRFVQTKRHYQNDFVPSEIIVD